MTQAPLTPEEKELRRRKIEQQLDEALAESFPASDPVSFVTSQTEEDWGETRPDAGAPVGSEK